MKEMLENLESQELLDLEMIEEKKESLKHLIKQYIYVHTIRSIAQRVEEGC